MPGNKKDLPSITFFSKLGKDTGYGQASKNFVLALSRSSINVKMNVKSIHIAGDSVNSYSGDTNINLFLHGPPYKGIDTRKYNIGYFYWEADKLPKTWSSAVKKLDEIWAPCELVRQACFKSGFKGPIEIVPTPSSFFTPNKDVGVPSQVSNEYLVSEGVFKFYSIFQWHERKGYKELLKAYFSEFTSNDDVILILKTNPLSIPGYKKENIKIDIVNIKRRLNLSSYPPVYLISDTLPIEDIYSIHKYADCYVAPHHGEGWGMPIHDAIISRNHIIVTKFGGVTEFLDEDSANIIEHSVGPVKNMAWSPLYNSGQNWAYPSVASLKKNMRRIYENRADNEFKKNNAEIIVKNMSIDGTSRLIEHILSKKRFKNL